VFLARAGFPVTVYEQAAELTEVGAGLQVSPNASRLLHRAGLAGHLAVTAVRPTAIEVRRLPDNAILARTELGAAAVDRYGAPYYTVHRARLHSGLLDRVTDPIRLRHRCVAITEQPDRVELRFADGSTAVADLVLGADGLHSVVRAALATDTVRRSSLTVHRGLIHTGDLGTEPAVRVWLGRGRHVVCYPISPDCLNVVAVLPHAVPDPLTGFPDAPAALRAVLPKAATRWPLADRVPLLRWCTGRIALLGDAAHPLLPFAAQGANQAIEDAATLAACLRAAGPDAVPEALRRYERIRIPRVARVAALVHKNTTGEHVADDRSWLYGYDAEQAAEPVTTLSTVDKGGRHR
jgi:salicylate hydroxylase